MPAGPVVRGAASAGCDLEGRRLVVQRDGINVPSPRVDQAIQSWLYYEVQQDGSALTVIRGLDCGYRVMPLPPPPAPTLAATGDASAAWPGILANDTHTGRTGSFVAEGSGCRIHFDDEYSVRGATASYFEDPSRPLPAPGSPAATAGLPGWEDWDADGNPGITVKVDSVLVGARLRRGPLSALLDAVYQPTPVPEQTGRTNYVDNARIGTAGGLELAWPLSSGELALGVRAEVHGLAARSTRKLRRTTALGEANGSADFVLDEVPDDAQVGTAPLAGREGLQTNNPGWPRFSSSGWLLGASAAATYRY